MGEAEGPGRGRSFGPTSSFAYDFSAVREKLYVKTDILHLVALCKYSRYFRIIKVAMKSNKGMATGNRKPPVNGVDFA